MRSISAVMEIRISMGYSYSVKVAHEPLRQIRAAFSRLINYEPSHHDVSLTEEEYSG